MQPTPQYGQMVSVCVCRDSSHCAVPAQLVLAAEHQGPGRTDADAVAAIDARGIGQRNIAFGRDPGVEAPARDRDREGVLGVGAARLDALVAEDAFPVVANVQVVVDLHRLGNGLRGGPVGRVMMARLAGIALRRPGDGGRGGP